MTEKRAIPDDNLWLIYRINTFIDKAIIRFLWFSAGAFAGYLWMARAYGLF